MLTKKTLFVCFEQESQYKNKSGKSVHYFCFELFQMENSMRQQILITPENGKTPKTECLTLRILARLDFEH